MLIRGHDPPPGAKTVDFEEMKKTRRKLTVQKAAEQGDSEAQFELGLMYARGEGVPKDETKAVHW
jgi:TPR repeat protein